MKHWIALAASLLLALASSVQAEEPHQSAEIKTIMERYKQGDEFAKIPAMSAEQRNKLMTYFRKGKEAGVKDRLLATGMGSIVSGYGDIEAVRVFVSEYQATGKMGKYLPMPYLSFSNAAEKFPEAAVLFANELEATKKMEAQIKSILEAITQDAERRTQDAEREGMEARRRTQDAERRTQDAERRTQDAERRTQKAREDIYLLQQILKALK